MSRLKDKIAACLLGTALIGCAVLPCFAGCAPEEKQGGEYSSIQAKALSPIRYTKSVAEQETGSRSLMVLLDDVTSVATGEEFVLRLKIESNFVWPEDQSNLYYVIDWGDGTWSYVGPTKQSASFQMVTEYRHVYKTEGNYGIRAAAFNLDMDEMLGWSEAKTVTVKGRDYETPGMITKVEAISSGGNGAEKIIDNDAETAFTTATGADDDIDTHKYVGLMMDKNYALDRIEIQIPQDSVNFPSNISIEYTTDHGENWTFFPKYYYLYDYEVGYYNPIMNFPNPKGATLVLDLDGICANGIRIASKLWPVYGQERELPKQFSVAEMRVYGTEDMLFYSSASDTFNADLNNMWTVFGTADSEPRTLSSIYGELPNHSPFRAGFPMIGVTEWLAWQSQKFVWTDYDEANSAMIDVMTQTKYGSDSWSGYDGYIWSTTDNPKHFGLQSHYQYNALFIMAVANYVLSGNFNKLQDINGNPIDFFSLTNKDGQSMWERVEKAMEYQLKALKGETGLLTIGDPENAGRVNSNASSYFDAYNWDGYLSAACNVFFYASCLSMADLYEYRYLYYADADGLEQAAYYRDLAALVKQKFNKTFWDNKKGRYIGAYNVDGVAHDYGLTYINTIACAFGMADGPKADVMFEWLNGERIVEGDTSQGEDIYAFKIAPRSNTVDISAGGPPYYWWDHEGQIMPTPDGWGGWPNQQNGGIFFWTSYYDVLGRKNYLGADDAFERFNVILSEFHIDQLRRMSFYNNGTADKFDQGIIGEYPESGLVPLTFLEGFLGIKPVGKGLLISPDLPSSIDHAGVGEYRFGGRVYDIRADKTVTGPQVYKEGEKYCLVLPANKQYVITLDNRLIEQGGTAA